MVVREPSQKQKDVINSQRTTAKLKIVTVFKGELNNFFCIL